MILDYTGTGATYEAAVEDAKLHLAAPEEAELHFETVQEAKKGLPILGIGAKDAMVRVWYEAPDPKPAPVKKESAPAKKESAPVKKENAPAPAKKEAAAQPKKYNNNVPERKKEAPAKKEPAPKPEEKLVDLPLNEDDAAVKFLRTVLKGMKIENYTLALQKTETGSEYIYNVDCGEDNRVLIGRRGETLDSIQYLLRLTENKGVNEEKHRKLSVNVGDYREKRTQNLKSEAQRAARQALKYGKNVGLEPMSPYERRIIHTTIQGIEGVTSHSVGSESNRRVIVSLEEGVTPTNPGRGGDRSGGYRDRGRSGGRRDGGRGKREAYQPSVTREPRKDSAGALYGKIEIPAKPAEDDAE